MLRDASGFRHVYCAIGKTDLRKGIDGLAALIYAQFHLDPYDQGSIFLFCGTRKDRIKALVYEGNGFVLLTKRLSDGHFQWPKDEAEVRDLTEEQFHRLMDGFAIVEKKTIREVRPRIL